MNIEKQITKNKLSSENEYRKTNNENKLASENEYRKTSPNVLNEKRIMQKE